MTIRFAETFVLETTANPTVKPSIYKDLYEALRNMRTDQSFLIPTSFNTNSAQTNISVAGKALNRKFVRYPEGDGRYRVFRLK